MTNQLIRSALSRVEANAFDEVMTAGKEIIARLRIPHTRTQKQPGGLQFSWNWLQTKMNAKYIAFVLKKMGYEPLDGVVPANFRDEFSNGTHNVLVAPSYGVLVIRPVGKEPIRGSITADGEPPAAGEFDEYDDYDDWLKDAKDHWPKARHNKQGTNGWVQGYGEENDEEFLIGPDMQSDVVGVWNTDDGFGWLMRSPSTA